MQGHRKRGEGRVCVCGGREWEGQVGGGLVGGRLKIGAGEGSRQLSQGAGASMGAP